MLVCRKGLKKEIVYNLTKNIYENLEYFKNIMDTQSNSFNKTINLEKYDK